MFLQINKALYSYSQLPTALGFFADFSINAPSITMKFRKHTLQVFRRLPGKLHEIWVIISKVGPFEM